MFLLSIANMYIVSDLGSITKITLSIIAFQRISVELQLQLQLQGQLQLQLLSNFIGLKLQLNY